VITPDTSVVIAALAPWHEAHEAATEALDGIGVRLVAHVAFETTSALSRMPEGSRIAPAVILEAIERRFPEPWMSLDGEATREALQRAVAAGVRGGALYDALIGATAQHAGVQVLTADRRARVAYESVAARPVFLSAA